MLREFDKTLTKAVQHLSSSEMPSPLTPSEKSLSVKNIPHQPREAALFMRNSLRCVLRKHFQKMMGRLFMRRACWRLVTSKKRRDMEAAFLLLRQISSQEKLGSLNKFYNGMP
jgi:hypothetical protein